MLQEEMRSLIIETSREIFSRFGYKKTTMDDIAHGVRKGKSSIYYYFKSKEEVFEAVVESEIAIIRKELLKTLDKHKSPQDKLLSYIKIRMKGFNEMVNASNAFKNEYLDQLSFIERIRQKYDVEEIGMIRDILLEGSNKGIFVITDPYMSALAIVTAMKGLEIPLTFQLKEKDLDKTIEELVNILFYGIVKRS
jgi:AcrR family transcriptional regulator